MMIGLEHKISGGQQYALHLGILPNFFVCRFHNQTIMLAWYSRFVFHPFALECYPGDPHLFHIVLRQRTGALGLEARELGNLLARIWPGQPGMARPWIVGSFGILHHLPKALETRITLPMKDEWSGCKIR